MRITAFLLMLLAATGLSAQQAPTTGYAPVNGLKMYYEIHGTGEPLVLDVREPFEWQVARIRACLLYTSPSPRD